MARMSHCTFVWAVAAVIAAETVAVRAEPLWTQGIGTSNCGRLAGDLKPSEGLGNPVNLMLYSWVQGYVSAANISMLEADSKHIDMSAMDEGKVLNLVLSFCKSNPDKRPINAVDDFLRNSNKIKNKWEPGTTKWDQ